LQTPSKKIKKKKKKKRRSYDYDDEPVRYTWIDDQFANINPVVLILFPLCCGIFALIFSIIGVCACRDPQARSNAIVMLCISGGLMILGIILQVLGAVAAPGGP
jgi:hypothetical protein